MMMIRRILVPLDSSSFAEQALPAAIDIARRSSAVLELVLVHKPWAPVVLEGISPMPVVAAGPPTALTPPLDEERRSEEKAYLALTAARVQAASGLEVETALLTGPPAAMLAAHATGHAAERRPDLIVMTSHGRGGLSRLWIGSVADALVRQVTIPVLLVKAGEDGSATPPSSFRRVVIALDGSALSESVIEPALAVAGATTVEYVLVSVTEPLTALSAAAIGIPSGEGPASAHRETQVQDYLAAVADRLRGRGVDVRTRAVTHAHPARAIMDVASESEADLIAMATHGRGGLRRLILGSTADKVVRGADQCVLLCRREES